MSETEARPEPSVGDVTTAAHDNDDGDKKQEEAADGEALAAEQQASAQQQQEEAKEEPMEVDAAEISESESPEAEVAAPAAAQADGEEDAAQPPKDDDHNNDDDDNNNNDETTAEGNKRKSPPDNDNNENATNDGDSSNNPKVIDKASKARKLVQKDMLKKIGVKAASTPYFIFCDVHRAQLRKEFPEDKVGAIGKRLGDKWRELSPQDKQTYEQKAVEDRARVEREVDAWIQEQGGHEVVLQKLLKADGVAKSDPTVLAYPSARIRRICKLDPEVRGLSKEALLLVTKAAELATIKLGQETVKVAGSQNRRKLLPDDVATVCRNREQFTFLKQDLVDLVREQQEAAAANENSNNSNVNHNKKQKVEKTNNPITSYFAPKAAASGKND